MIPLEEAQRFVLEHCRRSPAREMPLDQSLGCVAGEPVVATDPVPSFANSSMDGYAVRATDTRGAPIGLTVIGSVMAGHPLATTVGPGQAARIMTGAPLPSGADAVCMIEETRDGPCDHEVTIRREAQPGDFIRLPGRDVAVGDVIVSGGTELTPGDIGLLANQGLTSVLVHPRPTVGVLSTGDELSTSAGPMFPGQIRDANGPILQALTRREGWHCVDLGIVGDDEAALVDVLMRSTVSCDAIVTSGGVSVGDLDLVRVVLDKLSATTMRWMQVAIRPAKPFAFGILSESGTPVFGLPGNPVSAMVSFELFVRPALRLMSGHPTLHRPVVTATAEVDLDRRPDGKMHLLRARITLDRQGAWGVRTTDGQESHQLHSMASANGLILLADGPGVPAGTRVPVLLIDPERLQPDTALVLNTGKGPEPT